MAITNINWNALSKFNSTTWYAQQVKDHPNGGATVVHFKDGQELAYDFSRTDAPKSLTHFCFTRTNEQKRLNNEMRAAFRQTVINLFGTRIEDVPKKVRDAMNLGKFDGAGRPLTARRILAVNKAINAEMTALAKKFGMTGGAASSIFSLVTSNSDILQSPNPAREFKTLASRHATASIATHLASRASENLDYTSFDLDVKRGMGVTIDGKRAPQDPAAAHDRIAQFLTGNKTATFNGLDDLTQRKVRILMSLMHQGAIACFMTGVTGAFDHDAKVSRLSLGQYPGGGQFNSFAVTKDKAGNLTIKGQVTFTGPFIVIMSNGSAYENKTSDGNGTVCKYEGAIKLSAADLDKLANADWTQYDGTEVKATEDDATIPDRFWKAADLIPEPYKFTGSVDVSFKLHANALHNM